MTNNSNLELVKVNGYAKFEEVPSIHSQDIGNEILTIAKGHNCVV